ncbi:MAG: DUF3570 domain-containing protein [Polyangiaceae bacterium]
MFRLHLRSTLALLAIIVGVTSAHLALADISPKRKVGAGTAAANEKQAAERLAAEKAAAEKAAADKEAADKEAAAEDRAAAASIKTDAEQEAAKKPKPVPEAEYVKTASLETATYTDSDHVTVFTPALNLGIHDPIGGTTLGAHYLVDVVSAASVDIVSTASRRFREVRQAGGLEIGYKPHDFGIAVAASLSREPDYLAITAGGDLTYDFGEKNFSFVLGYNYGHDTIGRSDTPFSVFSRTLDKNYIQAALNIVVNRATVLGLAADVMFENGDQSKPYRYVPLFSPDASLKAIAGASVDYVNAHRLPERALEQLPLARRRFAITERLAHRFDDSTLRIEERVYQDTWVLRASTTDVRWIYDASKRFSVGPHLRYHIQSGTSFWQRAYVSSPTGWSIPEFRTGDRELGPLWTFTGGGGAKVNLGPAATPRAFAIGLTVDGMYTSYLDDLYITSRVGVLGALTFEVEL